MMVWVTKSDDMMYEFFHVLYILTMWLTCQISKLDVEYSESACQGERDVQGSMSRRISRHDFDQGCRALYASLSRSLGNDERYSINLLERDGLTILSFRRRDVRTKHDQNITSRCGQIVDIALDENEPSESNESTASHPEQYDAGTQYQVEIDDECVSRSFHETLQNGCAEQGREYTIIYDVSYSTSYQVPVLYISFLDAFGRPMRLSVDGQYEMLEYAARPAGQSGRVINKREHDERLRRDGQLSFAVSHFLRVSCFRGCRQVG